MTNTNLRAALLVTTALTVSGLATTTAFAQAPSTSGTIEEVVVTATRQTSTVNKVALSVSAVTQKSLDQQGIRNVADLSNQVPGFTFRTTGGDNNPQLTLRGVGGNAIGGTSGSAPTTGVYLDDLPMMKRNANGLLTGSGSPLPLLYDLDRVEILRGPQGTLYGGSSEGGTLRFITPTPSLTTYSGQARVGVSTIAGGGMGNEEGIALGGPVVEDKLGFRFSAFRQDRPGWVNAYSEYDGHQFGSQINKGNDYSLHFKALWQVTPDFKVEVGVFHQMNYDQDGSTVRTSSPAVNVPLRTFNNSGTVNGVAFSFPATVFGGYTVPAQNWLSNSARNGVVNGLYLTNTNVQYVPSPRRTIVTTPSVTLDYNWHDKISIKSITAYTDDRTSGDQFTGGGGMRTSVLSNSTGQPCPTGPGLVTPILTASNNCTVAPQYLQLAPGGQTMFAGQQGLQTPGPANVFGYYLYNNRRGQVTQEFRVSTTDPSWKLQVVGGAFIEHEHNHVNVGSNWNEVLIAQQMRGVNEGYFAGGSTGVPTMQVPGNNLVDVSTRNIGITEDEQSLFGEANYQVTEKFKLTAGIRVTNYTQDFQQQYGGAVAGAPSGFVGSSDTGAIETNPNSLTPFPTNYAACPAKAADGALGTAGGLAVAKAGCPYQYTATTLHEHPITPKVGASYQISPGELLYVTYSEGQRPGGINPPAPPTQCSQDLANLGVQTTPTTYQHDTVKSTELGGKFRLFGGRAQINASAFHIEWDSVQFVVPLPLCAFSFIANAGKANSDGAELQATGRIWGFTINGNVGYDKAQYATTVKTATGAILANKGDNLGVPDWTGNLGVQYDTHVVEMPAYARIDYTYTGKYLRATTAGSSSYNPATTPNFINGNETHVMNARVGVYYKNLEIAGYVKNLLDSREWVNLNQGSGNYYFSGNTIQPRLIGMQMNYRF